MGGKREHPLSSLRTELLSIANIALMAIIGIHDADHVRQAHSWCYSIPTGLWLLNERAYAATGLALILTTLRRRVAAVATSAAARIFVAVGFAKVHLIGTSAVWGIWKHIFFRLGADSVSWMVLAVTVATGLGVAVVGAWVAVNENRPGRTLFRQTAVVRRSAK
jgi:hypothetical protein